MLIHFDKVSSVVLLVMAAILLHNAFVIAEQPSSSMLENHPRWLLLEQLFGPSFFRLHMWMQPHGGTSRKGTLLYSNFDISSLWLPLDTSVSSEVETVHRRVDSTGTERVTGAAALKGTQAYPAQFGNRVADIFV